MASEFDMLDGFPDKQRGMGAIICLLDRKVFLRENLAALANLLIDRVRLYPGGRIEIEYKVQDLFQ